MSKNMKAAAEGITRTEEHALERALGLVKERSFVKFDESVDLAVLLGVDPRKSDQMVRGSVLLPHGTGKKTRVLVFAKGEKEKEATDAGAEFVGSDELVDKIKGGWLEFDKAVATPDMMGTVGKIGKILGPRGLMPNPKLGTVTFDVAKAIEDLKKGKVDYRVEKAGIEHMTVGKASFSEAQLMENATAALKALYKSKPSASKGRFIKKLSISTTMGPGVRVDVTKLDLK